MRKNIRIVLVDTSLAENIGAVARAMKTMGLSDLALVNPKEFPSAKAYAVATHATDLLDTATVYTSVGAAVAKSQILFATSARVRAQNSKVLSAANLGEEVNLKFPNNKIAILFGAERTGLTNEVLALCGQHIIIPTSDEYSSLNLAAAVQIIAYEILKSEKKLMNSCNTELYPEFYEKEYFFTHLKQILIKKNFINTKNEKNMMLNIRNIFNRTQINARELKILRGILSSIEKFEAP